MPSAVRDIGGGAYLSWTLALYALGSIVAGAATGLLVRRHGLRTVMAGAAMVFSAGCVTSALAPDMAVMLVGRVVQGIGGGAMLAGTFVGMNRLFPEHLWLKVVASVSAVWGASALVGPLVGGMFASWGLWRGGYWAFAAQSLVLAAVMSVILRANTMESDAPAPAVPWLRLALLGFAILAISQAGADVDPFATPLLCVAGLMGLAFLIRRDSAAGNRMFSPRPWSLSRAAGAATTMVFMSAFSTVSFTLYGPVLMQVLHRADPLEAGFYVASESVAWSVAAIAVSSVGTRAEGPLILAGSLLITLGVVGFAVAMPAGPMPALLPFALCQGAGFGMAWGFVVRRAIAATPLAERDTVSSSMPTLQMIGYAIGAAAAGIVANGAGFSGGLSADSAGTVAIWVFAAFLPFALWANIAAWRLVAPGDAAAPGSD